MLFSELKDSKNEAFSKSFIRKQSFKHSTDSHFLRSVREDSVPRTEAEHVTALVGQLRAAAQAVPLAAQLRKT